MIDQLIETLHRGNYSLVIYNGTIHTYNGRGVSDLYHIYTSDPQMLKGSALADKVVGKGAAALMVLGKVSQVHADIISKPAFSLLKSNGIAVTYTTLTDNIINRHGTGICPVESLCLDCKTAQECIQKISSFLKSKK